MTVGTLIRRRPAFPPTPRFPEWDRLVDVFHGERLAHPASEQIVSRNFTPRFRGLEGEDDYEITAELPGVSPADVSVVMEAGALTIEGMRKSPGWTEESSDEEKSKFSTTFRRRFGFNAEVDEVAVTARCKDGLLVVRVPKAKPEVRTISVDAT